MRDAIMRSGVGLVLAVTLSCAMSHGSDEPAVPTLWDVELNECECPGLSLFFGEDATVELGPDVGEICWVAGPRHPDVSSCFDVSVDGDRVTIEAWDVGCASTPCEAVVSEDGSSLIATCTEGLVGGSCTIVLSAHDS